MKNLLVAVVFLLIANVANGQNATATSKFAWNQDGTDLPTVTLFTYKYYLDGAQTGLAFPSTVQCSGTNTPFQCVVNIPIFTAGSHTVTITAANQGGESPKSAPLTFIYVTSPSAPATLRLIP